MEKFYLLMSLAGISAKKQLEFVDYCGSSDKAWQSLENIKSFDKFFSQKEIEKIESIFNSRELEDFMFGLQKIGVKWVSIESKNYSNYLKQIYDPPTVLYYKGDISLLNETSLAIVGARVCSRYGASQTKLFSKQLSRAGFVIVSGLAEGIDSIAQKECVDCGGKTIAVLAGGLNHIYPAINIKLSEEIVEKGGLLISENPPSYVPKAFNFVQRNRIIAGLASGVFVPEASAKSGSLHTITFAIDNGRSVFALPGPVDSTKSAGTNNLIKQLQACCVTEANDIIEQFPNFQKQQEEKKKAVQLSLDEEIILSTIGEEEMHFDEISQKTGMNAKDLNSKLTRMEIRGLIIRLAGNEFAVKH